MALTTKQMVRITGIGDKTLHAWAASGLLVPSWQPAKGTGTRKMYSVRDAMAASIIKTLRKYGLSWDQLAHVQKLVTTASDEKLSKAWIVAWDWDEEKERWRKFGLETDPQKLAALQESGGGLLHTLRDHVQRLRDTLAEMGLSEEEELGAALRKVRRRKKKPGGNK
jgi:DNA-binding transcriptional MerR regulator